MADGRPPERGGAPIHGSVRQAEPHGSVRQAETHDFVRELARDLAPVERIARLRAVTAGVLALWAAVAACLLVWKGGVAGLWGVDRVTSGAGAILAGLCLVGAGGLLAGLAASVPGRDASVRAGSALLAAGFGVAVGLGGWLLHDDPAAAAAASVASDVACLGLGLVVATLPSLAALLFVARATPAHPLGALAAAGAGCAALGGLAAQLGCMDPAFRHLIVSHALAPAIGAAILLAPLALLLRRLRPA